MLDIPAEALDLIEELTNDLRKDADGKVRLEPKEVGRILKKLGKLTVHLVGVVAAVA